MGSIKMLNCMGSNEWLLCKRNCFAQFVITFSCTYLFANNMNRFVRDFCSRFMKSFSTFYINIYWLFVAISTKMSCLQITAIVVQKIDHTLIITTWCLCCITSLVSWDKWWISSTEALSGFFVCFLFCFLFPKERIEGFIAKFHDVSITSGKSAFFS